MLPWRKRVQGGLKMNKFHWVKGLEGVAEELEGGVSAGRASDVVQKVPGQGVWR